jgi:hypothetical protein
LQYLRSTIHRPVFSYTEDTRKLEFDEFVTFWLLFGSHGCSPKHRPPAAERTLDRDFFMSAEEAKGWGLIDEIVTPRAPASEPAATKDER